MTWYPLPEDECRKIARRAVDIVRVVGPKRSGQGVKALKASSKLGEAGIYIPTAAKHLFHQEKGIRSFVMKGLEGKTIPIRDANGQMHFRRAKNVGSNRRITVRDERGRIVQSRVSWQHPGLAPQHFIDHSIRQAANEYWAGLKPHQTVRILREVSGGLFPPDEWVRSR